MRQTGLCVANLAVAHLAAILSLAGCTPPLPGEAQGGKAAPPAATAGHSVQVKTPEPAGTQLVGQSFTASAPPAAADLVAARDPLTRGNALLAAGEADQALRAFYLAAARDGASAEILAAIGTADLRLGRLQQAERALRRATEADPRHVPAWNNLGVTLIEQGRFGEAERAFRLAFALDQGRSEEIRTNLRLSLARLETAAAPPEDEPYRLLRRKAGDYLLMTRN